MSSRFFVYNGEDEKPYVTEDFDQALFEFLKAVLNNGEHARLDWSA